jgi:hypothetical protein
MYRLFTFISVLLVLSFVTFSSCKKKDKPAPTPSTIEMLTSNGSKTWQIEKLYINDTLFSLNAEQLKYTRTYKSDSTFFDSDGIGGKYVLIENGGKLIETLTTGGSGILTYKVESLTTGNLVLRLTGDGTNILNNQFHFRAK